jgi:glycosyltransferase involved in cell wall biosynthesis/predicted metal-dependent phosphoesterase TrpH
MIDLSRVDLHVHSRFSNKPSIWAMRKINCPESYTEPEQIYHAAKAKGMDFVTITDHNTIQGALDIAHLPGAFVSVELTSYFPENSCKIHVVVLNITEAISRELMDLRKNVYELVRYLRAHDIVHFAAHPLYDMDDRLDVDTVEKALLLFDVIEVRNGTRAIRFNDLTREIVASLGPSQYEKLREKHGDRPEWSARWRKSMVGGSDDHSGFFVARAHTSVPKVGSAEEFLRAVRDGKSRADGEDGDALTLAHTIYGIAYRFYAEKMKNRKNRSMPFVNLLLNRCFHTEEKLTIAQKIEFFVRKNIPDLYWNDDRSFEQFLDREARRLLTDKDMLATMNAEDRNRKIFMITSYLGNRMIYHYTNKLLQTALQDGIMPFLQSLGALGVIHALTSPYYVAHYHQHRSKPLLRNLRSGFKIPAEAPDRTALFTDTLHEINGVAMTIKRLVKTAKARDVELTVFTCGSEAGPGIDGVRTFPSIGDFSLPEYPELKLHFPPILDVIDAFEQGGFTKVHVSTPGTMGLLGLAIAKLMDVPIAATYHTDIPQYVGSLTNDLFLESTAWNFIIWFYNQMDEVMVPSKSTRDQLVERGLSPGKVRPLPRWVDTELFTPVRRNPELWRSYGMNGEIKFLYVGRVSKEKNLGLLADAFRDITDAGFACRLVIVGDGPYRQELENKLRGYPVLFAGFRQGEELAAIYASSDVFVFPSTTDTFGNVVLEAQASGIPVIVSDEGGPQELMAPHETGFVVKANDRSELARAMAYFLYNPELSRSMGEDARRFIESKAPKPGEVYSTILKS